MPLTGLRNKFFRSIGYFKAEIEIDDSKFETSIFTLINNGISNCIDWNIAPDCIHQGISYFSGHVLKIQKS